MKLRSDHLIYLIIILFVGTLLRFYHLNKFGIWSDEEETILIANGQKILNDSLGVFTYANIHKSDNVRGVLNSTIADNGNSIFYNLTLHFWLNLWGNSTTSSRALSCIFGVLIIILTFKLSDFLFQNAGISLFITLFVAIHPLLISFSQQARAYSLGTFLSLLSTYYFLNIILRKNQSVLFYLLYVLSATAALLSHYLTAPILLAQFIIFLLFARDKRLLAKSVVAGLSVFGLFYLWMIIGGFDGMNVLNTQNTEYTKLASGYQDGENAFYLPATFSNILKGWGQIWLQIFGNALQQFNFQLRNILVLIILPLFPILYTIFASLKNNINKQNIIILVVLTFTQTVFATILAVRSGHIISFQPLYTTFILPYAVILLGYSLYCFREIYKLPSVILYASITAIMLISLIPHYLNINGHFPATDLHAEAAAYIVNNCDQNNEIIYNSSRNARLINLHLTKEIDVQQSIDTTLNTLYKLK